MKKKAIAVLVVFLIVLSSLAEAESSQEECGFFCKIENWLRGDENIVSVDQPSNSVVPTATVPTPSVNNPIAAAAPAASTTATTSRSQVIPTESIPFNFRVNFAKTKGFIFDPMKNQFTRNAAFPPDTFEIKDNGDYVLTRKNEQGEVLYVINSNYLVEQGKEGPKLKTDFKKPLVELNQENFNKLEGDYKDARIKELVSELVSVKAITPQDITELEQNQPGAFRSFFGAVGYGAGWIAERVEYNKQRLYQATLKADLAFAKVPVEYDVDLKNVENLIGVSLAEGVGRNLDGSLNINYKYTPQSSDSVKKQRADMVVGALVPAAIEKPDKFIVDIGEDEDVVLLKVGTGEPCAGGCYFKKGTDPQKAKVDDRIKMTKDTVIHVAKKPVSGGAAVSTLAPSPPVEIKQLESSLTEIDTKLATANAEYQTAISANGINKARIALNKIKRLQTERERQVNLLRAQLNKDEKDALVLIDEDLRDYQRGKGDTNYGQAYDRVLTLIDEINVKYKNNNQRELYDRYVEINNQINQNEERVTQLNQIKNKNEEQNKELSDLSMEKTKLIADKSAIGLSYEQVQQIASDLELEEKLKARAESLQWRGDWFSNLGGATWKQILEGKWAPSQIIGGIAEAAASIGGRYQALSNLLLSDKFLNDYLKAANSELLRDWANLPSFIATAGPDFGFEHCEIDDLKKSNQPGQNYLFIETPSGIRQPVGTIFGEKSAAKVFLPCTENEDDQLACKEGQVCKTDKFCYQNRDAVQPISANFYKVTWGVGVPGDVSFTPYIDEAGQAVKFNIELSTTGVKKYLYQRGTESELLVLSLENGATDSDTVAFYSEQNYDSVCIKFHPSYQMKDSRSGDKIDELCGKIEPSTSGSVEFLDSKREQPSVTTQSEDVSLNRNI